ncbi:ATP-binding protein [bacterium]|nr:ATP-binding protein [bacterium]
MPLKKINLGGDLGKVTPEELGLTPVDKKEKKPWWKVYRNSEGKKVIIFPNPHLYYIYNELKNNFNHFHAIVGRPGSGKSYLALAEAYYTDETFDGSVLFERVIFPNEVNTLNLDDVPRRGAIIFDEMGVTAYSREFMSLNNRLLGKLFQICRHRNHFIILTMPNLNFIDKTARDLLNSVAITQSYSKSANTHIAKVFTYMRDYITGETRKTYYRVSVDFSKCVAKRLQFKGAPRHIQREYEKVYSEKKAKLEEELLGTYSPKAVSRGVEKKERKEKKTKAELIMREAKEILNARGEITNEDIVKIMTKYNASMNYAKGIINLLSKKAKHTSSL